MRTFKSVEEILIFAIGSEQEAFEFYSRLSGLSQNTEMKQIFRQYAYEELGHKARLIKFRELGKIEIPDEQIKNLKVTDYIVDVIPGPSMSYKEALIFAMEKEKAALRLYLDLASRSENEDIKTIFNTLAQEEARHHLRFEIEYDQLILKEN
ncbi:MAG: ferritin family protein [Lentimicrobium sp.]|nr:ferritin family protein [Lentimicrobium sp.]